MILLKSLAINTFYFVKGFFIWIVSRGTYSRQLDDVKGLLEIQNELITREIEIMSAVVNALVDADDEDEGEAFISLEQPRKNKAAAPRTLDA